MFLSDTWHKPVFCWGCRCIHCNLFLLWAWLKLYWCPSSLVTHIRQFNCPEPSRIYYGQCPLWLELPEPQSLAQRSSGSPGLVQSWWLTEAALAPDPEAGLPWLASKPRESLSWGTASRADRYWPIRAATYCLWISNSREDWPDRNKLSMKHSHAKKLRPHEKENVWVPELPWALNRLPVPEPLHQHSTPNPPFLCMAWENLYSLQL